MLEALEGRRLLSAGQPDSGFGTSGLVSGDFSIKRMQVQQDGKIVAISSASASTSRLQRFNANGTADSSFNSNVGGDIAFTANAIAVQADGKILIAGTDGNDFEIARYTKLGQLDTTFNGGSVTTNFGAGGETAYSLIQQPSGRILVAGTSGGNFAVARYTGGGQLDPSFGTPTSPTTRSGKLTLDFGGEDHAVGLAIQADGKIIVSGDSIHTDPNTFDETDFFGVARMDVHGDLDQGFATHGKLTTQYDTDTGQTLGVALDRQGQIILVGGDPHGQTFLDLVSVGGVVVRMGGSAADFNLDPRNFVVQSDGKIVVAGLGEGGTNNFSAVRFNADFTLDAGFGSSGYIKRAIDGEADAVAFSTSGMIYLGGPNALARYTNDSGVRALDNAAPTAVLGKAPVVSRPGGKSYTFTVTYADNTAVKASSFGTRNIIVTGPHKYWRNARLVRVNAPNDGAPRSVTYVITPPGGVWDHGDSGLYTIRLAANQVSDTSGYLTAAGVLGTFRVSV